jgi:putative hydrolase of the HAD superfamily
MIKAVTFDCWNTLIQDDDGRSNAMKAFFFEIFEQSGVPIDEERVDLFFKEELVLFENHVIAHRKTLNARDRAETILNLAGIELPEEKVLEIAGYCSRTALEHRPPLIADVPETLEKLSQDYQLGLICNTGWHSGLVVKEVLTGYDLVKHFTHLSFSDEVGVAKPHKQIFQTTLEKLGCGAEEAVHIGDSEYADIQGADQACMRSILFTGASQKSAEENTAEFVIDAYSQLLPLLQDL